MARWNVEHKRATGGGGQHNMTADALQCPDVSAVVHIGRVHGVILAVSGQQYNGGIADLALDHLLVGRLTVRRLRQVHKAYLFEQTGVLVETGAADDGHLRWRTGCRRFDVKHRGRIDLFLRFGRGPIGAGLGELVKRFRTTLEQVLTLTRLVCFCARFLLLVRRTAAGRTGAAGLCSARLLYARLIKLLIQLLLFARVLLDHQARQFLSLRKAFAFQYAQGFNGLTGRLLGER